MRDGGKGSFKKDVEQGSVLLYMNDEDRE